jgi:DNA-binding transcriptional ArsR family regulator
MNAADLQKKASSASTLLKVLANENRLLLLCQLVIGEKTVNELAETVGIRQSALSQHLAILRREGVVSTRREAQFIFYRLSSEDSLSIMSTLYEIYCQSDSGGKPVIQSSRGRLKQPTNKSIRRL